jgi:hypothetical protein
MWTSGHVRARVPRSTEGVIVGMHQMHLDRLGIGFIALGIAGLTHHPWGASVDLLQLTIGGVGTLWAVRAGLGAMRLACIVLAAAGFFAALDGHVVFTDMEYTLLLLLVAALMLIMSGRQEGRGDPWPLVQAEILFLVAAFALLQFAADRAAAPWAVGAPILVIVLGAALLLLGTRGHKS